MRFEAQLTEISSGFVNLPPDQIDIAIKKAQRSICEFLGFDRSVLWQIIEREPVRMLLSHIHEPPDSRLPDSPFDVSDNLPWILNQILRGEIVAISRLVDIPPEADRDRESLKNLGNKSILILPMSISGKIIGALSFGHLREEATWDDEIVKRLRLVAEIFTNALARKQFEESLESRLRFEALLLEISARFVNLPADQIDDEIEEAQRRICEYLEIDLSALWQLSDEAPHFLTVTHLHSPPEGPERPEGIDAKEAFPWALQKVLRGELLVYSTESMPPEAAQDQESRRFFGIKSSVVIPLSVGGGPIIGILTFDTLKEERSWLEPIVKDLSLVAQIFTNALARKRTDRELRESEARLNLATDAAGAGLWIMTIGTGEVWVSEKTRDLYHFSPDEKVAYQSFFNVIHPDDHEQVQQAVQQTLQSGETLRVDYRILLPDGSIRWIGAHGQRYPSTDQVRLMGISFDITERLTAEAEARQHRKELAHLTRVATMGELTTSLAHEINQPLTAIRSNAGAAQRFLSQPEPDIREVLQILEDIVSDNNRASEVVKNVRTMVRKEKQKGELLDLNNVIQGIVDLIRDDSLLEGLSITLELIPEMKMIHGNRIQLQQVILNLILNSAAAMRNTTRAQRKIIVRTAMPDNRTVNVSVTDFGTGIDANNIDHLFEAFYTTKPEGLGMGLSISQTIANAHGGDIKASNNRGGGATFVFTFPANQGDAS